MSFFLLKKKKINKDQNLYKFDLWVITGFIYAERSFTVFLSYPINKSNN
jgi:hypothetical protein